MNKYLVNIGHREIQFYKKGFFLLFFFFWLFFFWFCVWVWRLCLGLAFVFGCREQTTD
jgi:hypothetical protein